MDMPDATTLAHGVVSEDRHRAIFLVSQLAMPDYTLMAPLRVAGLEAGARYRGDAARPSRYSDYGRGRPHHA
jgi:alpha-galactosidase